MLLCGYGRQRDRDGLFDAVGIGLTFSNETIYIFGGLFVEFDVEVEVGGTKVLHRRVPIQTLIAINLGILHLLTCLISTL